MTEATIPGICVSTGAEVIDLEDSTLTATAKVVDLVIDAFALGENYDDVADQIQAEVEAKLYADNASGRFFGGLVLSLIYSVSDKKYNGDGAVKSGIVRSIWKAKYLTEDGHAETAL